MMNHAPLMRVSEAARIGGCSVDTVKRDARNGRLPFVQKLDGRTGAYLFALDAVQAWAAARQSDTAADTELGAA